MPSAHVYLHFALGMLLGAILGCKPLLARWYQRQPLYPGFAQWILLTYLGGCFAIVPSFCRMLQIPESFCRGWWMNIFLLHPLIDRLMDRRGLLIGELLIVGIFSMQYLALLIAIANSHYPAATVSSSSHRS